jgi:hypothetical protein
MENLGGKGRRNEGFVSLRASQLKLTQRASSTVAHPSARPEDRERSNRRLIWRSLVRAIIERGSKIARPRRYPLNGRKKVWGSFWRVGVGVGAGNGRNHRVLVFG